MPALRLSLAGGQIRHLRALTQSLSKIGGCQLLEGARAEWGHQSVIMLCMLDCVGPELLLEASDSHVSGHAALLY